METAFIARRNDRGVPRYLDAATWTVLEDRFYFSGGQELVPVDDDPKPAEPLVCGRLQRLPVLPLLELPVPRHDDDTPSAAEPALRERDPAPLGDPHPERARARLDPRHADVGMTVEAAEAT